LGLEIHELPRLGASERTPLSPGMALTIEPGVYLQELGGIRIEDTVALHQTGIEVLTPASKDLIVI
jgi:Xaa-Pro aminopeptidase